jgi:hypothetical protein
MDLMGPLIGYRQQETKFAGFLMETNTAFATRQLINKGEVAKEGVPG